MSLRSAYTGKKNEEWPSDHQQDIRGSRTNFWKLPLPPEALSNPGNDHHVVLSASAQCLGGGCALRGLSYPLAAYSLGDCLSRHTDPSRRESATVSRLVFPPLFLRGPGMVAKPEAVGRRTVASRCCPQGLGRDLWRPGNAAQCPKLRLSIRDRIHKLLERPHVQSFRYSWR